MVWRRAMTRSEQAKLLSRFSEMKAKGLRDMKFYLNACETTVEQACADINRVYDLVERGDVVRMTKWGDSNKAETAKAA